MKGWCPLLYFFDRLALDDGLNIPCKTVNIVTTLVVQVGALRVKQPFALLYCISLNYSFVSEMLNDDMKEIKPINVSNNKSFISIFKLNCIYLRLNTFDQQSV